MSIWDIAAGSGVFVEQPVSNPGMNPRGVTFSPSGRFVIASDCYDFERGDCTDVVVTWFNAETGAAVSTWRFTSPQAPNLFTFNHDSSLLALSGWYGLRVFNVSTDEVVLDALPAYHGGLFSPDGRLLLVAHDEGVSLLGVPGD